MALRDLYDVIWGDDDDDDGLSPGLVLHHDVCVLDQLRHRDRRDRDRSVKVSFMERLVYIWLQLELWAMAVLLTRGEETRDWEDMKNERKKYICSCRMI